MVEKQKETGGPAFPTEYFYDDDTKDERMPTEGMTLRDHFAGLAMQALIQRDEPNIAWEAYRLADTMLKEREQ